jgi:putative transposase
VARDFIADAIAAQGIDEGQLTIHADRGSSMTSKPVAQLLVDLGVTRTHSRPHISNDNPYSEANFKTLKYCPAFPGRFGSIEDARSFCASFFEYYNHEHRSPFRHRPAHGRVGPLRHRRRGPHAPSADPRCGLRRQPRPVLRPDPDRAEAAHRGLDQPAHPRSAHTERLTPTCLSRLDKFRPVLS